MVQKANINKGFSALELMLVLPIVVGLIVFVHEFNLVIFKAKQNNQISDQVKIYEKAAVMYLDNNYRNIVLQMKNAGNDVIVPSDEIFADLPPGIAPTLKHGEIPCLYITKDPQEKSLLNGKIKAYLILGQSGIKENKLTFNDAMAIANNLGSAGVMVRASNGSLVKGLNFNVNKTVPNLSAQCGFQRESLDNAIILDLTQSNNFFAELVPITNPNNDKLEAPKNPSLQKAGNNDALTMHTNLYLDNVIYEDNERTDTYCSASSMKADTATPICNNFAMQNGYELIPGSCSWDTSIKYDDDKCLSTVRGNYIQKIMGCARSSFGNAEEYCPANLNGGIRVPGTAHFNGVSKVGNECQSEAFADYQAANCDFHCTVKPWSISPTAPRYDCGNNINNICSSSEFAKAGKLLVNLDDKGYIHGDLDNSGCKLTVTCMPLFGGNNRQVTTYVPPNFSDSTTTYMCGVATTNTTPDSINSLGYIRGGDTLTTILHSSGDIPAEHRYRALQLGGNVRIKNDAPTGVAVLNSKLSIEHAGIQAGLIGLESYKVNYGDNCQAFELGKIVQQGSTTNVLQAELRCSYSPVACSTSDYCYLPIKTASQKIYFTPDRNFASCPTPLVLASNQTADLLDTTVQCPDLKEKNYTLMTPVHEEVIDCPPSRIKGLSFCTSVKSLCSYRAQNGSYIAYPINAIKGIQCAEKNYTYVVDDYHG